MVMILVNLRYALAGLSHRTAEEQEFIVSTRNFAKEQQQRDLRAGRKEGGLAHARATLRRLLVLRKLVPNAEDDARIDACADLRALDRWIERVLTADSAADALEAGPAPPRRRKVARAS